METERCLMSLLKYTDFPGVERIYRNAEVRKYLGGTIERKVIESKFNFMIQSHDNTIFWVVRDKQQHKFIGMVSIDTHHDGTTHEISYQFLPEWWGLGYAIEVVREMKDYAWNTLYLSELTAETQIANKASCKLLEKIGMKKIREVRRFGADQVIYKIKRS